MLTAHLGVGALAFSITETCLLFAWPLVWGFIWQTSIGPAALRINQRFLKERMPITACPQDFGYVPRPGHPLMLRYRVPTRGQVIRSLADGAILAVIDSLSPSNGLSGVIGTFGFFCLAAIVLQTVWWIIVAHVPPRTVTERLLYRVGHMFAVLCSIAMTIRAFA